MASVVVLGAVAFERRLGHEGGALLLGSVPLQGGESWFSASLVSAMRGHREKRAVCKPGRDLSPGTQSTSTWILNLQPPDLSYSICYSSPS